MTLNEILLLDEIYLVIGLVIFLLIAVIGLVAWSGEGSYPPRNGR